MRGNLVVRRQSLMPRVLSVSEGAAVARKPFKPPCSTGYNQELPRRLLARKRFVPWGSMRPVLVTINNLVNVPNAVETDTLEVSEPLPPGVEPLVLWQSEGFVEGDGCSIQILVDPLLVRYLRPHQREGVQFMFECVSGLLSADGIFGCILADDMGLGKTLQSIALLYTLLHQGFDGKPIVRRALIVTPTSLVSNWESEITKWVRGGVRVLSLCESTKSDVISGIDNFMRPSSPFQVLIISYETFRMHSSKFEKNGSCDLLICDEAHRLKNDQTLTNKALASLPCSRRILLSGTPMQNDLEEFFSMVNFTNPGILGDAAYFRRYYEAPIICGREPLATVEEKQLSAERSAELSTKVNQFILRRTNALLSNHLPPKLIYDTIRSGSPGTSGFEDCMRFFPPELFSGRSGAWTGGDGIWVEYSGKMHVLARLLCHLRQKTDDRIVLVSNYTQTLDLFAQLCRERRYPYLRLDGSTSISKRQKLVDRFNDPSKDEFAFLLSSKAGGCGLNLIGGNRLVLFDPDWNPANDKQAAARVWRDGQRKRVYQRQMSKEGLQKVIQQDQVDGLMPQGNFFSTEDLRDLFSLHANVRSEIHENMNCIRCKTNSLKTGEDPEVKTELDNVSIPTNCGHQEDQILNDVGGFADLAGCLHSLKSSEKQIGSPLEEDLRNWGHHSSSTSVPDTIFQASAGDEVTFVFTNQVDGKLVPIESAKQDLTNTMRGHNEQLASNENSGPSSAHREERRPAPNGLSVRKLAMVVKPLEKGPFKLLKTSLDGFKWFSLASVDHALPFD
ncbi:DNA repair and recombination protein RAD54 [Acorus gramineus]|uniref:DNA repair and recombination protein RAD54 n=1 Tax=Acorus gramineus TaxID=55184 RepID=A0AAV9AH63_ACOGR|nr:DNA repair and recombination protein RAD54 [Acorus gramineus]